MMLRPPRSTLFPYPTLFRSQLAAVRQPVLGAGGDVEHVGGRPHVAPRPVRVAHGGAHLPRSRPVLHGHPAEDRKSTRLNSSHANISYAVFCLKNKTTSPSNC